MLLCLQDLKGYTVQATDGEIGAVADFYFDDLQWNLRYAIIEVGQWLAPRKVLITPAVFDRLPNHSHKTFSVSISREQVRISPDIDTNLPITRRHEFDLHNHYGWNPDWFGTIPIGIPYPDFYLPKNVSDPNIEPEISFDPHLYSAKTVKGYSVQTSDEFAGHVTDFIAEIESWKIRYLVVDNGKWLPSRKCIVASSWIKSVSAEEEYVNADVPLKTIHSSLPFSHYATVTREYEQALYSHYNRKGYWEAC